MIKDWKIYMQEKCSIIAEIRVLISPNHDVYARVVFLLLKYPMSALFFRCGVHPPAHTIDQMPPHLSDSPQICSGDDELQSIG